MKYAQRKTRKTKAQIVSILTLIGLGLFCMVQWGHQAEDKHVQLQMQGKISFVFNLELYMY